MTIAVRMNKKQQEEWSRKETGAATIIQVSALSDPRLPVADALIDLLFTADTDYTAFSLPPVVLVNAVIHTCRQLPPGFTRINAWPGFLQRPVAELASGNPQNKDGTARLMQALGWDYRFVPDLPGFITATVIAMIINEAWFALAEGVSSREEINTAMKLGTNYPYGPFEWCDNIGCAEVLALLQALSANDMRYKPAPLLVKNTEQS